MSRSGWRKGATTASASSTTRSTTSICASPTTCCCSSSARTSSAPACSTAWSRCSPSPSSCGDCRPTTPLPLFGIESGSFPGYLIWTALAYAGIGTLVAHLIGWRLIPLQFNQQRYEFDFRFAIARVTDNAEPVALMGGEAVEREELRTRFWRLVRNWTALVQRQTRLIGFTAGYGHISTVFPILVVSPAYLTGAITLGALMQAHLAFQRVEGAFAFCIGAYPKIAEWKAIVDRLAQFEAAMAVVDAYRDPLAKIAFVAAPGPRSRRSTISWCGLPPASRSPRCRNITLAPGEGLLVSGPSGSGKSSLFRALAGLWPLGDGAIRLPAAARACWRCRSGRISRSARCARR